jgi:hypothetical protein
MSEEDVSRYDDNSPTPTKWTAEKLETFVATLGNVVPMTDVVHSALATLVHRHRWYREALRRAEDANGSPPR